MNLRSLIPGAVALTLAGLYSRLTGTVFRILLARLIGDEGIGLVQMVLPIYWLALTFATLGLPAVLAKVIAEKLAQDDRHGAGRDCKIVFLLTLASTSLVCLGVYVTSGTVSNLVLTDPRTEKALAFMPPAIAVAAVAAIFRGYFQGRHELTPGAWAQVLEQTARIPTVLLLTALLLDKGMEWAVTGVIAGIAIGELAGLAYLIYHYRQTEASDPVRLEKRSLKPEPYRAAVAGLLKLSIPLMAGGLAGSLTATADAVMIPHRLQAAGLNLSQATSLYGQLTGMALPVLYLPMVGLYPLATALIPAVSAAAATGDKEALRKRMGMGIRLTLLVSAFSSAAFLLFPDLIAQVLYADTRISPLITVFGLCGPVFYLQNMLGSYMTGLGLTGFELRNYVIGLTVRAALIYYAIGIPGVGLTGAIIGMTVGQAIMAMLHVREIRHALKAW